MSIHRLVMYMYVHVHTWLKSAGKQLERLGRLPFELDLGKAVVHETELDLGLERDVSRTQSLNDDAFGVQVAHGLWDLTSDL